MASGSSDYYWAGGQKIPLRPSTQVVLDLDSDLARAAPADALRAIGKPLTGSLLMVPKAQAEDLLGAAVATAPGVHPVFHSGDTEIVVLPQVWVEAPAASTLDEIGRSLTHARITQRTEDRLVIEPDSGRGEDALALANRIAESAAVDAAQARFMRVLPHPRP